MYFLWQQEWLLGEKVEFDGINKLIIVHPEVVDLNIRDDVYRAWVRWLPLQHNTQFLPALRYTGFDPIPGGYTGDTYFLSNGWKLVVNITKVKVDGVLFSDTADTAYYDENITPVYPAKVSSLFSVIAPTVSIDGIAVPSAAEIRNEIDLNSSKLNSIASQTQNIGNQVRSEISSELAKIDNSAVVLAQILSAVDPQTIRNALTLIATRTADPDSVDDKLTKTLKTSQFIALQ